MRITSLCAWMIAGAPIPAATARPLAPFNKPRRVSVIFSDMVSPPGSIRRSAALLFDRHGRTGWPDQHGLS
jgi:hypothetical protein